MGNAVESDAQQMKNAAQQMKIKCGPSNAPVVEKNRNAIQKFLPAILEQSTQAAQNSNKELKGTVKKDKTSSVLGGDKKITATLPGLKIGYTYYDFQTNQSMPERLAYWNDGSDKFIQMFWMASLDSTRSTSAAGQIPTPGMNDARGAHYAFVSVSDPDAPVNQYDKWEKMEAEKIAGKPERRGWPSIVQFKDGSVGTPSHTPVDFFKTSDYGDNTFTRTIVDGTTSTWPRAAVDGKDNVHIIYNTNADANQGGGTNFLCYRRSTDKGKTWQAEKIFTNSAAFDTPSGQEFPRGPGGDGYAIAARDNNVVVVYGTYPFADAIFRKSTDNGVTWSLPAYVFNSIENQGVDTVIYDGNRARVFTDTVVACGNQFDVTLDSKGNAHFVFNLTLAYHIIRGTKLVIGGKDSIQADSNTVYDVNYENRGVSPLLYKEANIGFGYVEEGSSNPPRQIVLPSTINWDGNGTIVSRRYASGIVRYPQFGTDDDDNLYLCFTSIKSGDMKKVNIDTALVADGNADIEADGLMGHIYVTHHMKSETNPNWSVPKDITPEGVDCLFGTLCNKVINGRMYIGYSADATPGDRVTNTELPVEQTEIYMYPFPTASLNAIPPVGVEEEAASNDGLALTSQPNPTSGITVFAFTAPQTGNATVTIINALGMSVATLYNGLLTAGTTHSVNFDAQNLASGAYYATLEINGRKVTKMVTIVK